LPGEGSSPPKAKKMGATAKFLLGMKGENDGAGGGLFGDKRGGAPYGEKGGGGVFGEKVSAGGGGVLFGEKDGGGGGLFGEKSEARKKYNTGLFTGNTAGGNLFDSQQQSGESSVFEGSSALFQSAPCSDFSYESKKEESSLFTQKPKPSIKSRLGTLVVPNREEEDESIFSKPRLVRTAIFGKTDNLGEMEEKWM